MRILTSKDGDFSSHFHQFIENNIDDTTWKEIITVNRTKQANKKNIRSTSIGTHYRICNAFKKVTKNIGFRITFKTNELQDIVYTTLPLAINFNVTFDNLHLYDPNFIPSPDTQIIFNESIKKQLYSIIPTEDNRQASYYYRLGMSTRYKTVRKNERFKLPNSCTSNSSQSWIREQSK